MKKSFRVMCCQMQRNFLTIKMSATAVILLAYFYWLLRPVADFARAAEERVYPWFFPVLTSDYGCQILFIAGGVFLISYTAISEDSEIYLRYRSGSFCWVLGNIGYMIAASFLYVVAILLMGFANLADVLEYNDTWGSVWKALAGIGSKPFPIVPFSVGSTVLQLSPVQAFFYSFLLEWLCVFCICLLIFSVGFLTGKKCGVIIISVFFLMDIMIHDGLGENIYWLSPITLSRISFFDKGAAGLGITPIYSFWFFGMAALMCVLVLLWHSLKHIKWALDTPGRGSRVTYIDSHKKEKGRNRSETDLLLEELRKKEWKD